MSRLWPGLELVRIEHRIDFFGARSDNFGIQRKMFDTERLKNACPFHVLCRQFVWQRNTRVCARALRVETEDADTARLGIKLSSIRYLGCVSG